MSDRAAIDAALTAQGVDAVYCINLPDRADRRRFMAVKLEDIGLDHAARWWPAIDGRAARWRSLFELFHRSAAQTGDDMKGVSPGALGLLLTWQAWARHVLATGYDRVCLLEDDIYFDRDFAGRLARERHPEAPIVYLGGHQLGRCTEQKRAIARGEPLPVSQHWPVWGTFGLVLSRSFLTGFMATLDDPARWDRPIDGMLWQHQRAHESARGIIIDPPLIAPEVRESANMGPRDLHAFAESRGLELGRYRLIDAFDAFIEVGS